ncbi:MAG: 2'-5' RNA ligase family protein [Pseudomonadota bacterium]
MGSAISIVADNATADPIRDLWQEVSVWESAPSMEALGYPPHFTFAICPGLDALSLWQRLEPAAAGLSSLRIRFSRIRHFPADPLVLWAAPDRTDELTAMHNLIHSCLKQDECEELYRPGAWVAHCTLAMAIGPEHSEAALNSVGPLEKPFEVEFDLLNCVSFPPLRTGYSRRLRSA